MSPENSAINPAAGPATLVTQQMASGVAGVNPAPARMPARPSALYRAGFWRVGRTAARLLPLAPAQHLGQALARVYAAACPGRREVVMKNLLPGCDGNADAASAATDRLFSNFAVKLLDLWRYEAGLPIDELFNCLEGRSHYDNALNAGRGAILVTPHLGNWEFGAPLLTMNGYKLHVITLAEPGHGLTEMRQAARARWGIETVVIGRDPFAFVDIIRRLEAGATIALLIDRPPASSAVEVQLFGKPFQASIAVAELARATGCALLPVHLTRDRSGYKARILAQVGYERQALRDRSARQQLTQQLMDVFAPVIREHIDQWYHFVPIWKEKG